MTEGIIQQVFTKWKKYSNTKQCTQDIIDIEKELIEKITQWILDSKTCKHALFKQDLDTSCEECLEDLTTLHDLIGDTQQ